ncbi:MAG: lytic transglycosylase domain-containing protein [Nitratireductor sp.]|nr:lytic transglycosylase domain-containing protein [Nitratireductor sp.]
MKNIISSGLVARLAIAFLAGTAICSTVALPVRADTIGALLLEKIPVPQPRPRGAVGEVAFSPVTEPLTDNAATGSITAITQQPDKVQQAPQRQASISTTLRVTPISGDLKSGLDALTGKDVAKALAIRAGLSESSLERKVLAWAIALSGQDGIPSAEIAAIASGLPDWPGQGAMRENSERALARENASPRAVIQAFGQTRPESLEGAIVLARAWLASGNKKAANAAIAPIWREDALSASEEKTVLAAVGDALTREDHRVRMHMLLYRERTTDGLRMASLAGRTSLAKAWVSAIRNDGKGAALLNSVDAASRKDSGYLFARVKQARRDDDYKTAAALLKSAPRERSVLIDPDEWWVERRIISRAMLDRGDARSAYAIAAGHSAESASTQAEAEFHAGWFALRFLNDKRRAAQHFANILKLSSTPITQSRANYWLARATGGPGAVRYYKAAAQHEGTFYGQLSAQAMGARKLDVSNPRPSGADRARFAARDQVRAIAMLEEAGYSWRADIIYRDLANSLNSPGELALLAARAEKRGNRTLALQIGKIAHARGLEVDTVSWPVGAIPDHAKIGQTGKALAYAIARQESAFNVGAVSPANAKGLLQLLPGTAKMMAKKTGVKYQPAKLTTDAAYNATLGAAYLSEQLDNFDNSYILTFAGYNAGPGRVRQWIDTYGDPRGQKIEDVVDWIERIPFTETRNYVQRVMENYQVYKVRLSNSRLDIEGDLRQGRR